MSLPQQSSRRTRGRKMRRSSSERRFEVETLEARQLLAADGIAPEIDPDVLGERGVVSGVKWADVNRNGIREANEQGLAGVTIYADLNGNGRLDDTEPSVVTSQDDPDTDFDEAGRYDLIVPAGEFTVREVVPAGYVQTFPRGGGVVEPVDDGFAIVEPPMLELKVEPGDVIQTEVAITIEPVCIRAHELDVIAVNANGEPGVPGVEVISQVGPLTNGCGGDTSVFPVEILVLDDSVDEFFGIGFFDLLGGDVLATIPVDLGGSSSSAGGHRVTVAPGQFLEGLDFGNARVEPVTGSIEGRKWLDRDGDGVQDASEPGLGGVVVYLDTNNDGQWNRGEPSTTTQFEDPFTDFDEGGLYHFGSVRPGVHTVRELVPEGYAQTFPLAAADVVSSETGIFTQQRALDFDVTDVDFKTADGTTSTSVELSVVWPDGCGQVTDTVAHTVIGNTILVDVQGASVGDLCTLALKTDTVELTIDGLEGGNYRVVGTLQEPGGASLGVVGEIEIGQNGGHVVEVKAGDVVSGLNFGNRQTGKPESVRGTKWNDKNGDGYRQRNEPGLGGVTIYADLDGDGELDEGEPATESSSDPNNLGSYALTGLEPGTYHIREVVPEGYRQTAPNYWLVDPAIDLIDPLPEGILPEVGSHYVTIYPGAHLEGLDFGNQSTEPGAIAGTKWLDANGDGVRNDDELGLPGVTIYVDQNNNGTLDESEPRAITQDDGSYKLADLSPGRQTVREVVPDGYRQTFPAEFWYLDLPFDVWGIDPAILPEVQSSHYVNVIPNEVVDGIDFGNQKVEPGSISGVKWDDANGNQVRDDDEAGLAGVTLYVDLNHNGELDENEPSAVSQADDPTTAVNEEGRYSIRGLKPYTVYFVREVLPEGYEQTYPSRPDWRIDLPVEPWWGEGELNDLGIPFYPGGHTVYVGSGQAVDGVDFGNRKILEPGVIEGTKWNDANGNGVRDEGERGLAGFTIFVDTNLNGVREAFEPAATTQPDDPTTEVDEAGKYALKVRPGSHLILEQQQRGWEQTHPNPARFLPFPYYLGQTVDVVSGETVADVDFGNKRVPLPATISGTKWFDLNANGVLDRGEEPMPGVTIYLDANDNGQLDAGETSTVTGYPFPTFDPDFGPIPESGFYSFAVAPGDYVVREVLPAGYIQTYPFGAYELGESATRKEDESSILNAEVLAVRSSSTSPNDVGRHSTIVDLETTWSAGEVELLVDQVLLEGDTIRVVLHGIVHSPDAERLHIRQTSVHVDGLEFGDYQIQLEVYEEHVVGPDGELGLPYGGLMLEMETTLRFFGDDAHRVSVEAGEYAGGLDFGNIAVPAINDGADSALGEDPHTDARDESATQVEFHDGHLHLNSFVDDDSDQDVFRFVSHASGLTGEGGRMDGTSGLMYELLDHDGNTLAMAHSGEPLEAATTPGDTYYLRVSGAQGQYQLDLFQNAETNAPEVDVPLAGDTNGDGEVDFADFLTLSANFGQQVDDAFASGDFDGDDLVSFADFLALSANFGKSS